MAQLSVNFSQQTSTVQLFPRFPLLTSYSTQWNGINLEYHHQPPYEIPESSADRHLLAIQTEVTTPRRIEGYLDGQYQSGDFREGDLMFIPANTSHLARWHTEHRFLLLSLDPEYLTQVTYDLVGADLFELIPCFLTSNPLIYQLALALKTELDVNLGEDIIYVETMVEALIVNLLKHYSIRSKPIRSTNGRLSQLAIKQIRDYINTYLERNLSLSELANLVHLSVSHFSSEFKRATGVSPYQYVLQCRVERAKELLLKSQYNIADIAHSVGFAHQGHLSYHFKKRYGVTPGTIRK